MDEAKETDKTAVSVSDAQTGSAHTNGDSPSPSQEAEEVAIAADSPVPAPKEEATTMTASTSSASSNTPSGNAPPAKSLSEQESELVAINGLLLVALAGAMFYVGTVIFAQDSLLFFAGIWIYMFVAPPGTYAQGKSKMVSFTKEVAIAFALTFVLFLVLKALMPGDTDQAKVLTIILAVLGIKLVFYPYYNFKPEE